MSRLQIIGDEVHFEQQLVALIVDDLPATVLERLLEELRSKGLQPATWDDLEKAAEESAKGGLLRVKELTTIIARLKKDVP